MLIFTLFWVIEVSRLPVRGDLLLLTLDCLVSRWLYSVGNKFWILQLAAQETVLETMKHYYHMLKKDKHDFFKELDAIMPNVKWGEKGEWMSQALCPRLDFWEIRDPCTSIQLKKLIIIISFLSFKLWLWLQLSQNNANITHYRRYILLRYREWWNFMYRL